MGPRFPLRRIAASPRQAQVPPGASRLSRICHKTEAKLLPIGNAVVNERTTALEPVRLQGGDSMGNVRTLGKAQVKTKNDLRNEPPLRDLMSGKTLGLMMARDGVSHAELSQLIETVRNTVMSRQV